MTDLLTIACLAFHVDVRLSRSDSSADIEWCACEAGWGVSILTPKGDVWRRIPGTAPVRLPYVETWKQAS